MIIFLSTVCTATMLTDSRVLKLCGFLSSTHPVWDQFNQTKYQFPHRADIFYVARGHVLSVQGDAFAENDGWGSIIGFTRNYQAA
jgi:hypothetical protein